MMQAKIGNAMIKSLVDLRQQKGKLTIDDVSAMFNELATSLGTEESEAERFLRQEIEKLASHIISAKKEILTINPDSDSAQGIGDAALHLDAVIKTTEEASHAIMDAADEIQAAVAGVGGEAEQKIMDASMRIYEACNFQDLNGQRITKVMQLLSHIEERISKLNELFRVTDDDRPKTERDLTDEKNLLNGPQLPTGTPTQADIDALFNDF